MRYLFMLAAGLFFYIPSRCQGVVQNEQEIQIEKVLDNKNDVDFKLFRGGGSYSSFKYFLRNDTLWYAGSNLYATVIPLANIDFERKTYFLESSLYKTEKNDKCIEVPVYAIKGKRFEKEFEIEVFKQLEAEPTTDFANLVLPDKAFAEAFMKYLKEHRR